MNSQLQTVSNKLYEHLYSPVAETHYTSKVRPTHKLGRQKLTIN